MWVSTVLRVGTISLVRSDHLPLRLIYLSSRIAALMSSSVTGILETNLLGEVGSSDDPPMDSPSLASIPTTLALNLGGQGSTSGAQP